MSNIRKASVEGQQSAFAQLGLHKTAAAAWQRFVARLGRAAPATWLRPTQAIRNMFFNNTAAPTERQQALHAATSFPKAKELGATTNPALENVLGQFEAPTRPLHGNVTQTPVQSLAAGPGGTTHEYAPGRGRIEITPPAEAHYPTGNGRTIRGNNATATLAHEGGERRVFQDAMRTRERSPVRQTPQQARAVRERDATVMYDTHLGPAVHIQQLQSRPGREIGARNAPGFRNADEAMTFTDRTPGADAVRRLMHQIRPSAAGDFPLGGRHQRALNNRMSRLMVTQPDMFENDLRAGFSHAAQGLPVNPTLEQYFMDNSDAFLQGTPLPKRGK